METPWEPYVPGSVDLYIPVSEWGSDHWSTFAYLETRVVDDRGLVDNRRMRCNSRLHRDFMHMADGKNYPTRLKGGKTIERHDDWSCLEDMVSAGLVRAWYDTTGEPFGGGKARVELTELGSQVAGQLREHKASGGKWGEFVADLRYGKPVREGEPVGFDQMLEQVGGRKGE
jgi:hypothetical protein